MDPDFYLDRLVSFQSSDYLQLKFPLDWLKATCEGHPSRALEKLKAHSHLVSFIKASLDSSNIGGSTDGLLKKSLIIEGLDRVTKEISSKNLYAGYQKLVNIETQEKRQARLIVNPSEAHNVAGAVLKWNQSEESKAKEMEFLKIYDEAMKSGSIKPRAFTSLAHYVRFKESITDKNRVAAYQLLNLDIASLKKQYWPIGYTGFGELPVGWDPNVPPTPGAEPSSWIVKIPGKKQI